jgi:hypothetical protein
MESQLPDLLSLKYLYERPGSLKAPHYVESRPGHYVNRRAFPRAFLAGGWEVTTDILYNSTHYLGAGLADARSTVFLPGPPEDLPSQPGVAGEARIVSYGDNRVEVECRADRPGLLVLTDNYFPQWSARVDGRRGRILPAFGAFRAVPIREPGWHRVVFRYVPWDLFAGLAISVPAWLLLAAFLLRRRRTAEAAPGPWGRLALAIVGNGGGDSVIMPVSTPRSDDMAKKNRRPKNPTPQVPTPPPVAAVPPAEEPPKAAVLAVRLVLLALAAYVAYQVFLQPKKGAPAAGAPPPPVSKSAAGKAAPPLQVGTFARPLTVDGIPLRRGYQGWGDGPMLNRSVRGLTLTVNGKTYAEGIGSHAPAELQFELDGRVTRFTCLLGADADGGPSNEITYYIKADDKQVFESPLITPLREPLKVDLGMTGVRRMTIIVKGDGSWDHADILNPRFVKAAGSDGGEAPKKNKK